MVKSCPMDKQRIVIEGVKRYPILHKNDSSIQERAIVWKHLAKELNLSDVYLKTTWHMLRERFKQECNKDSNNTTNAFKFKDDMKFMLPYISVSAPVASKSDPASKEEPAFVINEEDLESDEDNCEDLFVEVSVPSNVVVRATSDGEEIEIVEEEKKSIKAVLQKRKNTKLENCKKSKVEPVDLKRKYFLKKEVVKENDTAKKQKLNPNSKEATDTLSNESKEKPEEKIVPLVNRNSKLQDQIETTNKEDVCNKQKSNSNPIEKKTICIKKCNQQTVKHSKKTNNTKNDKNVIENPVKDEKSIAQIVTPETDQCKSKEITNKVISILKRNRSKSLPPSLNIYKEKSNVRCRNCFKKANEPTENELYLDFLGKLLERMPEDKRKEKKKIILMEMFS